MTDWLALMSRPFIRYAMVTAKSSTHADTGGGRGQGVNGDQFDPSVGPAVG